MTNAWQPLQPGDKVAVVFPSHRPAYRSDDPNTVGTPKTEVAHHKAWIQRLGLEPWIPDDLETIEEWGERQDAARRRAQHIIDALNDPTVKAIHATGGHGADEVIHVLEQYYSNPNNLLKRKDAPPLLGFSDATQLQLYLGEKGLVSPIQISGYHGNNDVRDLLFKQILPQNPPLFPMNEAAEQSTAISGTMIGGSDLSIYHAHRTNYRLQTGQERNNILLLEGRATAPDLIKTLELLQEQNNFADIKAIVLGKCYDHSGYEPLNECNTSNVRELARNLNIPVFFGAPFGHTKRPPEQYSQRSTNFLPLPLNTETTIKTERGKSTLVLGPVRTTKDVETAKSSYATRTPWQPDHTKDSRHFAFASTVFQTTILNPIHPHIPAELPKHLIGCCVFGCDLPAAEGMHLTGQDLLIYSHFPDGYNPDYWTFAQKNTMTLMELVKMGNAQDIKSITLSAPVPFPERLVETLREFTNEHFPGTPIFTTTLPRNTEMIRQLEKSISEPLLLNFKDLQIGTSASPTTPSKAHGI